MTFDSRIKGWFDVASSGALIMASVALVWTLFFKPQASDRPQSLVEAVHGVHLDPLAIRNVIGSGRLAIVEFSDFQCPYCARHATTTFPTLKSDLLQSGQVRYVAVQDPMESLHPLALAASEASECAAQQGHFWEMHERLFQGTRGMTRTEFIDDARAVGLNVGDFEQCIDDHRTLNRIRLDQAEARRLGVHGTPTFFVGTVRDDGSIDLVTRINGAAPAEVFSKQLAALGS
jgi:protein-disulfide isomerase